MIAAIGETYLVTTDEWFFAPDGESYRAVFGTVAGIHGDEEALGIKTNRNSTNWFLSIGNMLIAGCQIHYCIKTKHVNRNPGTREVEYQGAVMVGKNPISRIYLADE